MVNYFIYAKDFSSSTEDVRYYHTNGLKTLEQFKKDVERIKDELLAAGKPPTASEIVYLHWGHKCRKVNEEEARRTYLTMDGDGKSTQPETIIDCLKIDYRLHEKDEIKLLYIITDGCLFGDSADVCFRRNKDMHYERVIFHAFNEQTDEIDLSVASSFFKSRCEVYCNNERYDSVDISKEFDYDKVNVHNFVDEKDQLESYIKLKFIGKRERDAVALQEIDKLKRLRGRLFDVLSISNKVCLETKDRNVFLREFVKTDWYVNLNSADYDVKVDIEKAISACINYIVSDTKSYSFDALKFNKNFDKSVEEEEMVDVNFAPEQEIEFPDIILMDDDKGIPVIILTDLNLMKKIIFHGQQQSGEVPPASFNKFKSTMECPLYVINDQDVSESIGYFYTLNVYKQLLALDNKTEPRTRRPFHGGLVLTDTDQFDKYNDYILSATYFDCKKVKYNVGLFYFVLWKNCENKEWMDKNVAEHFKKYAMRRISETKCRIGLSSLPLDPQITTTLLTALWYCLDLSSCIFKNDPQNFKHERLRGYYGVARSMVEILKYFNYDLDLESIKNRRELISHVMILKKIQKRRDKVYYLLERIFKTVDGFLVSEIEKPFNLHRLNYLKLNHKEMLCDNVVDQPVNLNDYVHLMHFQGDLDKSKAGENTFEICEKTFRPYFVIDQNTSFYTELVKNSRKVVIINDDDEDKIEVSYEAIHSFEFDRFVSPYKLFIDCVEGSEKYPNLTEYVEYVAERKKFNEDLVTVFPSNVYFDLKDVYERYQKLVNKVEVKEFIKACKTYVSRIERIKAEQRFKFSSDSEISKFIFSEEFKVKLKRKTEELVSKNVQCK